LTFRERKQPFGAGSDPSNIVDAGFTYASIQMPGGLVGLVSAAARVIACWFKKMPAAAPASST
jgi:hypothetical protein